jgi:hypothetical protein
VTPPAIAPRDGKSPATQAQLDQFKVSQVSYNITSHLTNKKHHGTYCGRAFSSHIIRQRTCTDKGPRIVPLINHVLSEMLR